MHDMSTIVEIVGFRPHDKKAKAMQQVFDACARAGIETPEEVLEFFEYLVPDVIGEEIEIKHKHSSEELREVHEVKIKDLPEGVETIRFIISW